MTLCLNSTLHVPSLLKKFLLFAGLVSALFFTSCQKTIENSTPSGAIVSSDATTPLNVYVAGQVIDAGGQSIATYWRNGVQTTLSAGTSGDSYATSMFMYGVDRYAAGVTGKGATYWKNGVPVYIGLKDPNASITVATGMAVSGKDVYVSGFANTGMLYSSASYWKNGKETILNNNSSFFAEAKAITVAGSDVYVAGDDLAVDGEPVHGCIWKNGQRISIGDSAFDISLDAVAVSGADVYVGGREGNERFVTVARYWKNNHPVTLSNGLHNAFLTSLFISGTDVYAAGMNNYGTHNVATYWKNGQLVALTNGTTDAQANSIVVDNDHNVWVAGFVKSPDGTQVAVYWKNGARVNLSKFGQNGNANSIFLSRS